MLLTYSDYRVITGDTVSTTSAVTGALLEATGLIEGLLHRTLEQQTLTESLQITQTGIVFPTCVPVASIAANSAASGSILYGGFAINVRSGPTATFDMVIERTEIATIFPFDATVSFTYTGGYAAAALPFPIRRGIARLARAIILGPSAQAGGPRPAGASSVSMGDISVSYAARAALTGAAYVVDELVPGLVFGLREYDRRKWS